MLYLVPVTEIDKNPPLAWCVKTHDGGEGGTHRGEFVHDTVYGTWPVLCKGAVTFFKDSDVVRTR